MLALCSMLSGTYYVHNYTSIIGGSLVLVVIGAMVSILRNFSLFLELLNLNSINIYLLQKTALLGTAKKFFSSQDVGSTPS